MLLSVFVALSLTPALCATMLKPVGKGARRRRRASSAGSTAASSTGATSTCGGVRHVIDRSGRWLLIYGALIVAVGLLFMRLPTGFLPDRGPGHRLHPGADAAGRDAGAHARSCSTTWRTTCCNDEADAVDATFEVDRLQFRGPRPEPGPGVRAVQGLVGANAAPTSSAQAVLARTGDALRVVPGRGHHPDQSAVDPGAGQRRRASTSSSRIAAVSATTS